MVNKNTELHPLSAAKTPISNSIKVAIRKHYKWTCQYCSASEANEVEHILARANGGTDDLSNVTLCCKNCNLRKGTLNLPPYWGAIAAARASEAAPAIIALLNRKQANYSGVLRTKKQSIFDLHQISKSDRRKIVQISRRACKVLGKRDDKSLQVGIQLDIVVTHSKVCRLRLSDMLASDDSNVMHDVVEIGKYLDRDELMFTDCFWPRFASASLKNRR